MTHRCYSAARITADHVTIDGGEAHHLLHVLRAADGMRVVLFDGSGCEFDAEVTTCGRSTVELAILARREVDRELPFAFTLGVPLPKGDRQRWIVEKAVELGVMRLVPLHTARSVATVDRAGEKLDRYVIEASKQCGRNQLMKIAAPQPWTEWLTAPEDSQRVIADPTGQPFANTMLAMASRGLSSEPASRVPIYAAVGPEGGLTDDELAAARSAGWNIASLGPRILRIETAAIALATLFAIDR